MDERGSFPMAVMIGFGLIIAMVIGMAVCGDALFEDEDEKDDLGLSALVMPMDYDYDDEGDENSGNGRRCEGSQDCSSFSPSFEDSPVKDSFNPDITFCLPFADCRPRSPGDSDPGEDDGGPQTEAGDRRSA